MNIDKQEMLKFLVAYFESQQWQIESEQDHIKAVMTSGYGSGPAVIDLTDLAAELFDHASQ